MEVGTAGSMFAGPIAEGSIDVAASDAAASLGGASMASNWGESAVPQVLGEEAAVDTSGGVDAIQSLNSDMTVNAGEQGAAAKSAATGNIATDANGVPIADSGSGISAGEAAGTGAGKSIFDGITGSQALMTGLLASSLIGSMQKPASPTTPTPVTPPPSLTQSQAAVDPTAILNSLTGVGQGGGQKGVAQTLLSGAGGVDPSTLTLNKKTLLGA